MRPLPLAPRVGFLGRLGSGNLGNDASLAVVLGEVRERRPDAVVDFMCSGPGVVSQRHTAPAVRLHHVGTHGPAAWRVLVGAVVDAVRISAWVRHHDVVVVPGMGTLEATLRERPWQMPWTLLVTALSGRLWGTRVALVGIGAGAVPDPVQRTMLLAVARLVHYRSFRDEQSREALRRMGVRSHDGVYPDVVLALPVPDQPPPEPRSVGVGVMAWAGDNTERPRAAALHAAYVEEMRRTITLLLERGYTVNLLVGDDDDLPVAERLAAGAADDRVRVRETTTPDELDAVVASVEVVVAARFHNVVSALRCATPVVALCYAPKHRALMASLGLEKLCQDLRGLDARRVVEQVDALHGERSTLREDLARQVAGLRPLHARHFDEVARAVLDVAPGVPA